MMARLPRELRTCLARAAGEGEAEGPARPSQLGHELFIPSPCPALPKGPVAFPLGQLILHPNHPPPSWTQDGHRQPGRWAAGASKPQAAAGDLDADLHVKWPPSNRPDLKHVPWSYQTPVIPVLCHYMEDTFCGQRTEGGSAL